jgi:hypothetical protein
MTAKCMDTSGIPTVQYNFVPLSDLAQRESGTVVGQELEISAISWTDIYQMSLLWSTMLAT